MAKNFDHSPISRDRISALKLLEWGIYVVLLASFLREVVGVLTYSYEATFEAAVAQNQNVAVGILGIFFVLLMLRSYIDVQMTDVDEQDTGRTYKFVSKNKGIGGAIERLVRLLIVCVILLTPKSGISFEFELANRATNAVSSFHEAVYDFLAKDILKALGLQAGDIASGAEIFVVFLQHYGAAIFILGFLGLVYDVTNTLLVKYRSSSDTSYEYGVDESKAEENRSDFRSYLAYMGIRQIIHREDGEGNSHYSSSLQKFKGKEWDHLVAIAKSGGFLWMYLRYAPRFKERAILLLFSFACYFAARTQADALSLVALVTFVILYIIFARRDFTTKVVGIDLVMLPVRYFLGDIKLGVFGKRKKKRKKKGHPEELDKLISQLSKPSD